MQDVLSGIHDLETRSGEEPGWAHTDLAGMKTICQALPARKAFYFYYTLRCEIPHCQSHYSVHEALTTMLLAMPKQTKA